MKDYIILAVIVVALIVSYDCLGATSTLYTL